jgi:hypothetical protein
MEIVGHQENLQWLQSWIAWLAVGRLSRSSRGRWIDRRHLRKGRVGPWDVGLGIIQMIKRGCLESLVMVV